MSGLAHGGHAPVLITFMMGVSSLIVGALIDPLSGLIPLFGILCLMVSAFFVNFWRDPDRPIPKDPGVLVSPADGHVMFVRRERATGRRPSNAELQQSTIEEDPLTGSWIGETCSDPLSFETEQRFEAVPEGEERADDVVRVAIFMSPLDVHVNRAPMAGTIISGALARTIIPWSGINEPMRRGQRFGMIRLGSRVDIRVPAAVFTSAVVSAEMNHEAHPKGQFVQAGTTILFHPIAEFASVD